MAEYKFLCPECRELKDELYESFSEINKYRVWATEKGYEEYEFREVVDGEWILTYCECGFETLTYRAWEFMVKIEGDKIEPYGKYWEEHREEFEEIIKELNGE